MKECFADTSYFIALLSPTDEKHMDAVAATSGAVGRLATTTLVIVEVGNAVAASRRRNEFVDLYRKLRQNRRVSIIEIDGSLFDRGMSFYESYRDKEWSLTDCVSFVVMRDHGVFDALTADHHFEQAGFKALLK